MKYYEFRAMNTDILMGGEGFPDRLQVGFRKAREFIEASERRFTRFDENSELNALNRSAGEWFEASADLYEVVALSQRLHVQSRGLFDPGILSALEMAGYDRSMELVREGGLALAPVYMPVREKPAHFSEVLLDRETRRIWLPPALRIDLGGIAKGWIAERAVGVLSSYSSACMVDAGGDAFMSGLPQRASAWRVMLEDPTNVQRGLAVLKLGPGAVATSSITRRRWQQGVTDRHHLIDPRTLEPAETDFLSVTVVAPHAVEAEVYAKSLLIAGSREIYSIAGPRTRIDFFAFDQAHHLWGSPNSRELLDV
jgi:thiamine biosynthesis lipoprotein